MKITWYGTASILIESGKDAVLFDPFMKDLPPRMEPVDKTALRLAAFQRQKHVVITHGHFDHLSSIVQLYRDRAANMKIYLPPIARDTLLSQQFPAQPLHSIVPGDTVTFGDIRIHVYQGKHIKFDAGLILKTIFRPNLWCHLPRALRIGRTSRQYQEGGQTYFYVIEAEGKQVQLMGSADLDGSVQYPTCADVLILPHQGRSDIDAHNRRIALCLQPKRILLDHYDDTFPPISTEVETDSFCDGVAGMVKAEKMVEGVAVEI